MPDAILHDLGTGFTSGLWKAVMAAFDIKDTKSTVKNSQCNGRAEAQNRRINIAMRVSLSDDQWKNYDLYIKYIVFCLNSLVCSKTGFSANFLVYGRELRMPRDMFVQNDDRLDETLLKNMSEIASKNVQAHKLYRQVSEITRKVRDNAQKRAMYMCKDYDKRARGPYFEKGDICFLLVIVPKHKYADKWAGPYLITEKISDWNYIVDVNGVKKVVSISKMKPYKPNKYSELNLMSVHGNIPTDDKIVRHKPSAKKRQTSSDSSDDGEVIISIRDPQVKERVTKDPNQCSPRSRRVSKSYRRDTVANPSVIIDDDVTDDSDHTDPHGSHVQEIVDQQDQPISESADHGTVIADIPSALDTSGGSDQEFVDATEALDDVNTSMEQDNDSISSTALDFGHIDSRNIALSDIQRHETQLGLNRPAVSGVAGRSSGLTRSTTMHDLPRSSTRYGLRPEPNKVQRYGNPITALKNLTKAKRK